MDYGEHDNIKHDEFKGEGRCDTEANSKNMKFHFLLKIDLLLSIAG